MFLDTGCTYLEEYVPEHRYIFTGCCVMTGTVVTVRVKADELYRLRCGALIQDALVSNTIEEREFLLNGMSAAAWDILSASEEEE